MSSQDVTLLKAQAQDGAEFYIKTVWKKNSFEVWLLAGDAVWRGDCSAADVQRNSREYNETEEAYMSNARGCLSTNADNHRYELRSEQDNSLLFIWKTKFIDGPVMKCGSLSLVPSEQRSEREVQKLFIDYLIDDHRLLANDLRESTLLNDNLQSELTKALHDLKQVIDMKAEMESDMYGKFIQLLNSKKRRIQVLEQSLNSLNGGLKDKMDTE